MNYLLTLMFDGSYFHGWQTQKNAYSVQENFEDAIEKLFGERVRVQGCSRTDAGVHARSFKANFSTQKEMPCETVISGLNFFLHEAVSVQTCVTVPDAFNARFDCASKEYEYVFYVGRERNPFYKNRASHVKHALDVPLMDREAKCFLGTHDFSAFCAAGSSVLSNVRTVTEAEVTARGDLVVFRVRADGFLYNMVRIMAGTLLYISEGKIPPGEIPAILSSKDRTLAGKTAPPEGLYLNQVFYKEGSL